MCRLSCRFTEKTPNKTEELTNFSWISKKNVDLMRKNVSKFYGKLTDDLRHGTLSTSVEVRSSFKFIHYFNNELYDFNLEILFVYVLCNHRISVTTKVYSHMNTPWNDLFSPEPFDVPSLYLIKPVFLPPFFSVLSHLPYPVRLFFTLIFIC